MKKLIKNGLVAVIHSNDWGIGWSSAGWCDNVEQMLFDPGLAQLVLDNVPHAVYSKYITENFVLNYDDMQLPDLDVTWVLQNAQFIVLEYDGIETVVEKEDFKWITA
jgi:hypothetical protein